MKALIDISTMPTDRLLELHFGLFEAVEVEGKATFKEMQQYFDTRYELERRGCGFLPGTPCYERGDAA